MASQVKHTGARATDKQMSYIRSLAKKAGYSREDDAIKAIIGKRPVNGLSRERASEVIEELKGVAR